MADKCDICGFPIVGQQNYCSGCGVDLREPKDDDSEAIEKLPIQKEMKSPKYSNKEKKDDDLLRVIKWCWLRSWQLPHVLVLLSLLVEGKSEFGFCDCAICNQGYREILAFKTNLSEEKKLKASRREIVKQAQGKDITQYTLNIPELLGILGSKEKKVVSQGPVATTKENLSLNEGKILIELDEAIIERAVIKVLSSEEGQNIIKTICAPKKRGRKDQK